MVNTICVCRHEAVVGRIEGLWLESRVTLCENDETLIHHNVHFWQSTDKKITILTSVLIWARHVHRRESIVEVSSFIHICEASYFSSKRDARITTSPHQLIVHKLSSIVYIVYWVKPRLVGDEAFRLTWTHVVPILFLVSVLLLCTVLTSCSLHMGRWWMQRMWTSPRMSW
jgi:hypothetical protein